MKRTLTFAVALVAGAVLLAAGPVSAAKTTAPTAVTVVMHDPGCHWFSVNGAFKRTLTVKGPAVLTNLDEASLDIVGGKSGMHVAKIGKPVTLARGTYKIVMVNQANDDNVLTLFVK